MPTLYSDTGYTLTHLIGEIEHGNLALPDIQRPFVWSSSKTRDLFDSMYRGYPIGTLMFWETGAEVGTRQVGGGDGDKVPRMLIVDGQQRLTSLYAVLTGSKVLTKEFQQKRIRVAFRPSDESFAVTDAAIERDPEYVPDVTILWGDAYRSTVRDFVKALAEYRGDEFSEAEKDLLEERIDRVRDLRNFRFQVVVLSAAANEEQVADIFVRINSEGVQLNQADFILTLLSVYWEKGRRALEDFCRGAVDPAITGPSPKNPFIQPGPDQLLRASVGLAFRRGRLSTVYNLLRGKDLETGAVSTGQRDAQFAELARAQEDVLDLTNWHEFLKCLTYAGFRSRRMITSENALIYTYILWLVGRRDFGLDHKTIRGPIARWFFMAHTTGRYTSSPESIIEADFRRIDGLTQGDGTAFCDELDRIVRANFTGDYWDISLPNRLDTSSSNSPVLYAYWAALNLHDAELLFSDLRIRELLDPAVTAPRSIERHHLFPKGFLQKEGASRARQNQIANMAFLDWPDNAKISDESPAVYWPEMTRSVNPDRLTEQMRWHALPMGWETLEYGDFLDQRRKLIAKVVRSGFEKLWDDQTEAHGTPSLIDLIALGESQELEFKSSARWNMHTQSADKKLEHVITKTACGFLNAEGGTLLIGVADDGTVVGLDVDLQTLKSKPNLDGYELFLRDLFDRSLSIKSAGLVRISFESVGGHDVCQVSVAAASKPVFAKPPEGNAGANEFWVRTGNSTNQLHGDDLIQYRDDHWG